MSTRIREKRNCLLGWRTCKLVSHNLNTIWHSVSISGCLVRQLERHPRDWASGQKNQNVHNLGKEKYGGKSIHTLQTDWVNIGSSRGTMGNNTQQYTDINHSCGQEQGCLSLGQLKVVKKCIDYKSIYKQLFLKWKY